MSQPRLIHRRLAAVAILFCACADQRSLGLSPPTAAESRLESRLDTLVSVTWSGQTLANAIARLSELYDIDVWLDRRVDPHAAIEMSAQHQPLRDVFKELAQQHKLDVASFRGLVYVGPGSAAGELQTLAALARQSLVRSPTAQQRRWLKSDRLTWRRLSEPRRLVENSIQSAGAELVNPTAIPHDSWAERDSTAMPAVDRLVLLLSGFDLTCEISKDGRAVRVVPIERPVQIAESYPPTLTDSSAVRTLLQNSSDVRCERTASGFRVYARWEEHQQLQQALKHGEAEPMGTRRNVRPTAERPNVRSGRRAFTLNVVEQPLGPVLDQLARQLEFSVAWSNELDAAQLRRMRISCDVRQVDQDRLLGAVLGAAGLTFRPTDGGILVTPAD